MKTTTERLAEFIEFKGINNNIVTVEAGLSVGLLGKAILKNTGINSTSIEKILYAYQDLNPTWLLTGRGEMLRGDKKEVVAEAPAEHINYKALAEERKEVVGLLKEKIHRLEQDLSDTKKALKLCESARGVVKHEL